MKSLCVLVASLILMTGCQYVPHFMMPFWGEMEVVAEPEIPTHQVFLTPQFRGARPNRVVLVSSNRNPGSYDANDKLIVELAARFRADGLFEVVTPNLRLPGHLDNIQQGKFSERDLARIAREFNADAVGLVRVNELRAYSPIRTSITIAFVDSNDTVISCGIDGIWDLANANTRRQFQNFFALDGTDGRNQVNLQSPNSLFRFVASQVSHSVMNSGY